MSARELIIRKLLATPAITAVVGDKIYPSQAPQGVVPPFILVTKPGQENRQLLKNSAEMPRARVSLECNAASALGAEDLGDLLYTVLQNVTNEAVGDGASPETTIGTITVMPADSDIDDFDDERLGYRRIIDFYVDWR